MNLLITLDFPPETGGIQRYLHDIVMHTFSGEDVVITGGSRARSVENDRLYPCRIVRVGFPFARINKKIILIPIVLHVLFYIVKVRNLRIVAGNVYGALVPWAVSRLMPVRYQVYCYGTELLPPAGRSLRTVLWKSVFTGAETVYYLTGATLKLLGEVYACSRCVRRVPKIDVPVYDITENARSGRDVVHLLSVGRLVPHKGHANLISALAQLTLQQWRLAIVGEGPEYGRLDRQIRQFSLEGKVTIHTGIADAELPHFYRRADIFVLPSITTLTGVEGFGIVLLEAMAYGAAIIASRSGGIEEVVDNNEDIALLVPQGDRCALQEAIIHLISDTRLRRKMAASAREFLESRYAW